jgi:glycosyltransferase involved in cell wall biosynthesis
MKIAIHNGAAEWRGNEKQTATLAAGLTARGHEVVVSCNPRGSLAARLRELGIRTSSARPRGDLDAFSALRFALWLRRARPDVLLLTTWKRVPTAAWAARRAGVPRIVVRLGIVRPLPRARRFRRAFRGGVDAMIVNSGAVREAWLASAPDFPAGEVHLVLNGVDLPPAPAGSDVRAELGIAERTPLVAVVGGLERRKGVDILLDAFARVAPTASLLAAGDGPMAESLRARAATLGIAERVHWLGERRDVGAVLRACDAYVLPSRNEGMAVAMLEAMQAGLPVIATDVSGVRDALAPREGRPAAGWIVPPEEPAALAAALAEVLAGGAEVRARAGEGRWRIDHWFTVERMIDGVERALAGGTAVERSNEALA